ncbi:protein of unknown function [Candidatus Promineifilum breve]|uniref:Uncharacterized protein n=1 Tax=Candidatus Promineifilum breve TaxID=1806508 RepID=A0A160T2N3_9CHLR|nr:hypothetical protein [Candidatus Promineifilum breve]CUS04206.2 protein of unknown function [Candidatus Promineifilum breve]
MTDVIINASLNGPAVEQGGVEWRRLVQFGDALQKAIDRMAYSLEKEQGARRKFNEVLADTKLRLLDTKHGSFEMTLGFIRPSVLFEDYYDLASRSALKLVAGLDLLRAGQNETLPEGYDQGVLVVLQEFGKLLSHGVDSIDLAVRTKSHEVSGVYDSHTYSTVKQNIIEPEEKIAAVTGHLLMVNFGRERYRCHLYQTDDQYVSCTFDEDTIDEVNSAVRRLVNAIGIATIDPVTDEISSLHIKRIIVLDEPGHPPLDLSAALDEYIEQNDTLASFRRSWEEVRAGKLRPIADLWDDIDATA